MERRKPRDAAKFEATARACATVGWNYRLVGVPDPIVTANLRWLAGYRHPRHDLPDVREVLRRVFVTPTPLMAGTAAAGDPIAVLPVLFHLLWRGVLAVDVSVPLNQDTVARCRVSSRPGQGRLLAPTDRSHVCSRTVEPLAEGAEPHRAPRLMR